MDNNGVRATCPNYHVPPTHSEAEGAGRQHLGHGSHSRQPDTCWLHCLLLWASRAAPGSSSTGTGAPPGKNRLCSGRPPHRPGQRPSPAPRLCMATLSQAASVSLEAGNHRILPAPRHHSRSHLSRGPEKSRGAGKGALGRWGNRYPSPRTSELPCRRPRQRSDGLASTLSC